jgi:hypothetical protein
VTPRSRASTAPDADASRLNVLAPATRYPEGTATIELIVPDEIVFSTRGDPDDGRGYLRDRVLRRWAGVLGDSVHGDDPLDDQRGRRDRGDPRRAVSPGPSARDAGFGLRHAPVLPHATAVTRPGPTQGRAPYSALLANMAHRLAAHPPTQP